MKRYPQIRHLSAIRRELLGRHQVAVQTDVIVDRSGKPVRMYVPARGEGFASLEQRISAAWLVFTGRADALTWPEDDGIWLDLDTTP